MKIIFFNKGKAKFKYLLLNKTKHNHLHKPGLKKKVEF